MGRFPKYTSNALSMPKNEASTSRMIRENARRVRLNNASARFQDDRDESARTAATDLASVQRRRSKLINQHTAEINGPTSVEQRLLYASDPDYARKVRNSFYQGIVVASAFVIHYHMTEVTVLWNQSILWMLLNILWLLMPVGVCYVLLLAALTLLHAFETTWILRLIGLCTTPWVGCAPNPSVANNFYEPARSDVAQLHEKAGRLDPVLVRTTPLYWWRHAPWYDTLANTFLFGMVSSTHTIASLLGATHYSLVNIYPELIHTLRKEMSGTGTTLATLDSLRRRYGENTVDLDVSIVENTFRYHIQQLEVTKRQDTLFSFSSSIQRH